MTWRVAVPAAWLALLDLSIALVALLAAQHRTLPGDIGIATWTQDLAFPGSAFSKAARAITTTEVVLGTGGAVALVLWLLDRRWEAVLLARGLIVLPLLQAGLKQLYLPPPWFTGTGSSKCGWLVARIPSSTPQAQMASPGLRCKS